MYFQLPLIPITTSYHSADNYQPELSASQTLASFHQQAIMEDGTTTSIPYGSEVSIPYGPDSVHTIPMTTMESDGGMINASDVVTVTPVTLMPAQTTSENSTTHPQVKLPGGATLVAVTDRNADMLLKPKLLEKPHVTITMGDKQIQQPVCLLTNTVKFLFYFLSCAALRAASTDFGCSRFLNDFDSFLVLDTT